MYLGQLGQQHRRQHQQHRTNDGPKKRGPAQEGEQQVATRALVQAVGPGDDFEVDRGQAAPNACKKPAMMNAK